MTQEDLNKIVKDMCDEAYGWAWSSVERDGVRYIDFSESSSERLEKCKGEGESYSRDYGHSVEWIIEKISPNDNRVRPISGTENVIVQLLD